MLGNPGASGEPRPSSTAAPRPELSRPREQAPILPVRSETLPTPEQMITQFKRQHPFFDNSDVSARFDGQNVHLEFHLGQGGLVKNDAALAYALIAETNQQVQLDDRTSIALTQAAGALRVVIKKGREMQKEEPLPDGQPCYGNLLLIKDKRANTVEIQNYAQLQAQLAQTVTDNTPQIIVSQEAVDRAQAMRWPKIFRNVRPKE